VLYVARGSAGGGGALELWNIARARAARPTCFHLRTTAPCSFGRDVTVKAAALRVQSDYDANYSTVIFRRGQHVDATVIGTIRGGQAGCIYISARRDATILCCCHARKLGPRSMWDVTSFGSLPASSYQNPTDEVAPGWHDRYRSYSLLPSTVYATQQPVRMIPPSSSSF